MHTTMTCVGGAFFGPTKRCDISTATATRFTAAAAVLMPVLLVAHLLLHKAGDPTFTSPAVLLAVMSLSWPIQLLRIRGSRRWEQPRAATPQPGSSKERAT